MNLKIKHKNVFLSTIICFLLLITVRIILNKEDSFLHYVWGFLSFILIFITVKTLEFAHKDNKKLLFNKNKTMKTFKKTSVYTFFNKQLNKSFFGLLRPYISLEILNYLTIIIPYIIIEFMFSPIKNNDTEQGYLYLVCLFLSYTITFLFKIYLNTVFILFVATEYSFKQCIFLLNKISIENKFIKILKTLGISILLNLFLLLYGGVDNIPFWGHYLFVIVSNVINVLAIIFTMKILKK